MSTDSGKITRIYWGFMLEMIKAILNERTVVCVRARWIHNKSDYQMSSELGNPRPSSSDSSVSLGLFSSGNLVQRCTWCKDSCTLQLGLTVIFSQSGANRTWGARRPIIVL